MDLRVVPESGREENVYKGLLVAPSHSRSHTQFALHRRELLHRDDTARNGSSRPWADVNTAVPIDTLPRPISYTTCIPLCK